MATSTSYRLTCVVACALFALNGCSRETTEPQAVAPSNEAANAPSPGAPKNCLLILLDAFVGDHASFLGYSRDTSPYLNELAQRGVAFSQTYAQCPNTLGSTVSSMTGRYLPQPQTEGAEYAITDGHETLAEMFQRGGFATASYSENPYIRQSGGFHRGFDVFEVRSALLPRQADRKFRPRDESAGPALLQEAGDWIRAQDASPWMCYVHLLRPHDPYYAPAPFAGRFRPSGVQPPDDDRDLEVMWKRRWRQVTPSDEDLQYVVDVYDGSIAYVDALVGEFLRGLEAAGALEDTLVVVYSDHGEAFMEHGEFKHNTTVYDEMLHVPLLFVPPAGSDWTPGTHDSLVELVDLFPTLADVFGLAPPDGLEGVSLAPAFRGETIDADDTLYAQTVPGDRIAFRKGMDKLIFWKLGDEFIAQEWYSLGDDPEEKLNLMGAGERPEALIADGKAAIARHFVPPGSPATTLDAEQRELLESLGYLEAPPE